MSEIFVQVLCTILGVLIAEGILLIIKRCKGPKFQIGRIVKIEEVVGHETLRLGGGIHIREIKGIVYTVEIKNIGSSPAIECFAYSGLPKNLQEVPTPFPTIWAQHPETERTVYKGCPITIPPGTSAYCILFLHLVDKPEVFLQIPQRPKVDKEFEMEHTIILPATEVKCKLYIVGRNVNYEWDFTIFPEKEKEKIKEIRVKFQF